MTTVLVAAMRDGSMEGVRGLEVSLKRDSLAVGGGVLMASLWGRGSGTSGLGKGAVRRDAWILEDNTLSLMRSVIGGRIIPVSVWGV